MSWQEAAIRVAESCGAEETAKSLAADPRQAGTGYAADTEKAKTFPLMTLMNTDCVSCQHPLTFNYSITKLPTYQISGGGKLPASAEARSRNVQPSEITRG